MKTLLKNGKLIIDGQREIHSGDILFDETGIINFGEHLEEKEDYEVIDVCGCIIQPGFIDIHMHGAIGKDFVIGKEAVNPVGISLLQDGTTGFLASLTVLSHEEELKVLKSLKDATSEGAEYLGVHMEGPYLSKEYKALMNETYLRDPVISELDEMLEANPNIKVMTIAPERKGMEDFIPYLVSKSIVPMIGHTASSTKEALRGLDLGAKGFTHLYNAMSQHTHRNPGCVTAALEHKNSYKELIMDGFHNDVEVVKASWRVLGPEEIIMITDCMLGKGMPDGEYTFSELRCRKVGNTVRVIETGRIAGSAISMNDAARFVKDNCNATARDIVQIGCVNPAKLLNLDYVGTLNIGCRANIAVFDENYHTEMVYVNGERKWQKN